MVAIVTDRQYVSSESRKKNAAIRSALPTMFETCIETKRQHR